MSITSIVYTIYLTLKGLVYVRYTKSIYIIVIYILNLLFFFYKKKL